jgi:hypothetical protein
LALVALLPLSCDSKFKSNSDREIAKQANITLPDGKTETCVDGEKATCTRAGGRWGLDVAWCCLPRSSCDFGDDAACTRAKGSWTGKYCCLPPDYRYAPGDEASCAKLGGAWTGARCYVK